MKATLLAAVLAAACLLLTACGGGGDDVEGNPDETACPVPAPATPGMSTIPTQPCGSSRV